MVAKATDYRWSSAKHHCFGEADPLVAERENVLAISNWAAWLEGKEDRDANQFLRDCTSTGRPCGQEDFVKQIERELHRDFTRKKPGPKPKVTEEDNTILWADDRIVRQRTVLIPEINQRPSNSELGTRIRIIK